MSVSYVACAISWGIATSWKRTESYCCSRLFNANHAALGCFIMIRHLTRYWNSLTQLFDLYHISSVTEMVSIETCHRFTNILVDYLLCLRGTVIQFWLIFATISLSKSAIWQSSSLRHGSHRVDIKQPNKPNRLTNVDGHHYNMNFVVSNISVTNSAISYQGGVWYRCSRLQ